MQPKREHWTDERIARCHARRSYRPGFTVPFEPGGSSCVTKGSCATNSGSSARPSIGRRSFFVEAQSSTGQRGHVTRLVAWDHFESRSASPAAQRPPSSPPCYPAPPPPYPRPPAISVERPQPTRTSVVVTQELQCKRTREGLEPFGHGQTLPVVKSQCLSRTLRVRPTMLARILNAFSPLHDQARGWQGLGHRRLHIQLGLAGDTSGGPCTRPSARREPASTPRFCGTSRIPLEATTPWISLMLCR